MSLRICLVTPFAWSQPHDVNEHVAGIAVALRARGHRVTVIAPSTRAAELQKSRRALQRGELPELLALGSAVPVSRTSALGIPVGARASLAHALRLGGFDVVHGFEPGLPSLSSAALLEARSITAATFFAPERVAVLPRKARRARLLARVDALLATSPAAIEVASRAFPGDYASVPIGVDLARFAPARKRRLIVAELAPGQAATGRAVLRGLRSLPGWELVLARSTPLTRRPSIAPDLRGRTSVRSAVRSEARQELLGQAAVFVPAPGGSDRLRLEAEACGCAIADPPGLAGQPELAAAAVARLAESVELRTEQGAAARSRAQAASFERVAEQLEGVYRKASRRRRHTPGTQDGTDPLADRDLIVVDLHMHTRWSHDCSIEPQELIDHAEAEGLGAIAVTDHNVFGGALETVELARRRDLIVIPGEEMKTDNQGEVIGLFLREEIPRGLTFAETIEAIREQDAIVYLPHPFDRRHAIPSPATLHRHLPDIDVLEVYNARLLSESFNDEALRFARKYGLLQGAGSDAHVLPGVGTGALRMRRFDGPEEFLLALRTAEVLRRPKSLAYLQSLKWVAQVKEKVL